MSPDVLVVSSIRRWVAEEYAPAAARRGLPLLYDLGFDVPDLRGHQRPAWWAPAEHAARLHSAGVTVPLLAPGPTWLTRAPRDLLGREVWAGTLAELGSAPRSGWCKPAEAKVAALPAAWWDDTLAFGAAARGAALPEDAWVQVCPDRLELEVEHRAMVVDGEVLTTSPYLLRDGTTYHEGMEDRDDLDTRSARAFAQEAADALGADQCPAHTLDVGRTTTGRWVVVESNPAWCAGAYGCDMDAVLETTLRAVDHAGAHPQWHWEPDPHLVARARRQRVLSNPNR